MQTVGVGMIGAGMIGQGHAYALRLLAEDGDVRPVAVTDFSADAVEAARAICPFERVATDAQAVVDDPDVEAIVIVTPTTTHRDLVRAAVAAGKPLLCEKPLATRFDIVREMCALVGSSGLTAQVGFHSRFHPLINELVKKQEKRFVDFFNNSQPVTPRMHSLELLPGIGKKSMWTIVNTRERKPFTSYKDIEEKTGLTDVQKMVAKRIFEELSTESKYRLFTRTV